MLENDELIAEEEPRKSSKHWIVVIFALQLLYIFFWYRLSEGIRSSDPPISRLVLAISLASMIFSMLADNAFNTVIALEKMERLGKWITYGLAVLSLTSFTSYCLWKYAIKF